MTKKNVQSIIKAMSASLTNSERNVASVLLENYPLSGLGGITALAEKAGVSTPTITRLVGKLGFKGYSDFQQALKHDLDQRMSQEILGGAPWSSNVAEQHVLNNITESVMLNVQLTLQDIDTDSFDSICELLSDTTRKIYISGGRVSGPIADHLYTYLHVLRSETKLIKSSSNSWHHSMIDIKKGDVLVLYDIRRYESVLLNMAQVANDIGAEIILLTDQLKSPIAEISTYCLSGRIMMPNSRSSLMSHLLLNEVIIFQLQNVLGDSAKQRWNKLDSIFQSSKFFHK